MENTAEKWRNPHTNQYHATRILEDLEKHTKQFQNDRLLGVTDLDRYVPGMNLGTHWVSLTARIHYV